VLVLFLKEIRVIRTIRPKFVLNGVKNVFSTLNSHNYFTNNNSRREYMFIGNKYKILSNPEGIVCKSVGILHIIPSGLERNILQISINIYSLRELYF
jgi:hypothetical protein